MEIVTNLYKIMLILSAAVMLVGFILNTIFNKKKSDYNRMILLMTFVNLSSILIYLANLKTLLSSNWSLLYTFLDITIMVLNMVVGYFLLETKKEKQIDFSKLILNLFGLVFISDCLIISIVTIFKSEQELFDFHNSSFWWIFIPFNLLLIFGTFLPALKVLSLFKQNRKGLSKLTILLLLNLFCNAIGFYFYILKFPTKEISTLLNMIVNLVFCYFLGYMLIEDYFASKKEFKTVGSIETKLIYTWEDFKNHIHSWNEARSYLLNCIPEIVTEVEKHNLTDLEKVHFCLKNLKVTSKDVAEALNVSNRTVETQRYRIGKKILR